MFSYTNVSSSNSEKLRITFCLLQKEIVLLTEIKSEFNHHIMFLSYTHLNIYKMVMKHSILCGMSSYGKANCGTHT